IIPGVIDAHVHFRDLDLSYKEDFLSGSQAAIAGGVTTVLEMPNSRPKTNTLTTLKKKKTLALKAGLINIGFHVGLPEHLESIKELLQDGIVGVKIYPDDKTSYYEQTDDDKIKKFFQFIENLPVRACIHAEEPGLSILEKEYIEGGMTAIDAYFKAHEPDSEARVIKKLARIALESRVKLHFCHVSTRPAIEFLKHVKKPQISCEITPHHLLLLKNQVNIQGTIAKMLPPLRSATHVDALWEGIRSGIIDILATDHAPHAKSEKERDFTSAPSGLVGLETFLPLCLTLVNEKRLKFKQLIQMITEIPAKLFGLKNKGIIDINKDADLTLINMSSSGCITPSRFKTKARFSPFDGWKYQGKAIMTIVNGKIVMEEDQILKQSKPGKILKSVFIE
ncbi:MAG: dihydroorotase, partial [Candidatus Helarchaeota archaeon]